MSRLSIACTCTTCCRRLFTTSSACERSPTLADCQDLRACGMLQASTAPPLRQRGQLHQQCSACLVLQLHRTCLGKKPVLFLHRRSVAGAHNRRTNVATIEGSCRCRQPRAGSHSVAALCHSTSHSHERARPVGLAVCRHVGQSGGGLAHA
eukprot:363490-Chlamydomonas_euryale.AAC.4